MRVGPFRNACTLLCLAENNIFPEDPDTRAITKCDSFCMSSDALGTGDQAALVRYLCAAVNAASISHAGPRVLGRLLSTGASWLRTGRSCPSPHGRGALR